MTLPEKQPPAGRAAPADEREYPRDYRRLGADILVTMRPLPRPSLDRQCFQSWPGLAQRIGSEPVLPVAALIFHCSRCGSTLLARLLELDPALRVFSEPPALPKFLAAHSAALRRGAAVDELRTFIQAFGLAPKPPERRLIMKLTSRAVAYLPAFRAAFPGTPFVYLFRDPAGVVASLDANPPPFLRDDQRREVAAEFDPHAAEVESLGCTDWLAWYVDRNLRLAWRHRAEFGNAIDYADHNNDYLDFARRFAPTGQMPDPSWVARVLNRHSKNPELAFTGGAKTFAPDWPSAFADAANEAYRLWQGETKKRSPRLRS